MTQIQCPTCKTLHDTGVRFCPQDGTPLTETPAVSHLQPTSGGGGAPAAKPLDLPVVVGERYRLTQFLGGGGMAKVYKATDLTLDRDVAVKLINQELRTDSEFDARFQREARIASQLADPHIVVVHDFGISPELGPYLVMEYLHGGSLREQLQSSGPLPYKTGLQLAAQLMLALIHAHEKNIVHRDIKPDNLFLLNQSGVRLHVRVLDFGIARMLRGDAPSTSTSSSLTLTTPGAVLGTPRYMSPEQLAGQTLDARSDLYSAALVIHETLTCQLPYVAGKTLMELCPEATPEMQALLDACLKQNPNERPSSAVEVYLRLQDMGKASGILMLPPGGIEKLLASRKQETHSPAAGPAGVTTMHYPGPTVTRRPWLKRAAWITGGVLAALTVLGILTSPSSVPPRDQPTKNMPSVFGVKVGDGETEVIEKLSLGDELLVRTWDGPERPAFLGRLLSTDDLCMSEADIKGLHVRKSNNHPTAVLFHQGKVCALVSMDPKAVNSEGVHIGDSLAKALSIYADLTVGPDLDPDPKTRLRICRSAASGIGFEIAEDSKIKSMTLYPAVKAP